MSDELRKHKAELMRDAGDTEDVYPPLDFQNLTDTSFYQYCQVTKHYHQTGNGNFAILAFVDCVRSGFAPPPWVLNALCNGFEKYLHDKNLDSTKLPKYLQLVGEASGKPQSFDLRKHITRIDAMGDMSRIIALFGISKLAAARAVKDKYGIAETAKHIARYYREKWAPLLPKQPDNFEMNISDHQELVRSFRHEFRCTFEK